MEVGIIGLGVAGISILREISKQTHGDMRDQLHITVYSERDSFGTGFPYQPDDETLLINQYTESMSIDPDNPKDFLEWVKKTKNMKQLKNTHLPRALFGEYLSEKSSKLIDELNVTVLCEKVIAVQKEETGKYLVQTANGSKVVDAVHLSVGHLAYQDPYNLKGHDNYIYNPYPANKLLALRKGPISVGIVGTGLTAIDTFLYLKKHHPRAKLSFLSLDERFSSVRGHEPQVDTHYFCQDSMNKLVNGKNKPLTLEIVKKWFEQEMVEHGIDLNWVWTNLGEGTVEGLQEDMKNLDELGKFQALIRKMRDCYALLWNALPNAERDRFLSDYGRKWSNFKAPIPQRTAQLLITALLNGDIQLLSGIKAITKDNEKFTARFDTNKTATYDYIINATGQQMDLTKELHLQQPLIIKLVVTEMLIPHPYGGVWIDYPTMCALNKTGENVPGLYIYGQLASGIQYGNSNVELISKSAHHAVKAMLEEK